MTSTFIDNSSDSGDPIVRHVPWAPKVQSSKTPELTKNCQLVDSDISIPIGTSFFVLCGAKK